MATHDEFIVCNEESIKGLSVGKRYKVLATVPPKDDKGVSGVTVKNDLGKQVTHPISAFRASSRDKLFGVSKRKKPTIKA